jgi:hypothetical protein
MKAVILLVLLIWCTIYSAAAQEITLRSDITFDREDGSRFVLRRGTVLAYTGTNGLNYVVATEREGDLLIPEALAAEYHRAFSDRRISARYVEIAASIRAEGIVPTHARVMDILDKELARADTDQRLESIERKLDDLTELGEKLDRTRR